MMRAVLALIAVSALVAVLVFLTLESRSVNEAYFLQHAERLRLIDEIRQDLDVIVSRGELALLQGRDTPEEMASGFYRLESNSTALERLLTGLSPADEITRSELADSLAEFRTRSERLVQQLDDVAVSVGIVQQDSAAVIRELRDNDLLPQSVQIFSLTHDLMGYLTGSGDLEPASLFERLEAVSEDSELAERAPGLIDDFIAAVGSAIERRESATRILENLQRSSAKDQLNGLAGKLIADHRAAISRAERARVLLFVSALVLVAGVGFAVVRLQASYRDLNATNAELAIINESLEERVRERTSELSTAYEELKESQVQLVQAEKMSSLGELVAGISHEINTPLWYLINNATTVQERLKIVREYTDISDEMIEALVAGEDTRKTLSKGLSRMRRMLADGLKDDVDEAVDLIDDSIQGLEELTELAKSLKDFSRLDRAQSGRFNVNEGLEKTLLIAKNRLKGKVEIEKDLGDVPDITCAPSQINQVLLNLLTNAADAIDDQGKIRILTTTEDEWVLVRISDTGRGIPEEHLDKIRDPFFTTKEVGQGTGLGMSIVDRIVDAHHGRLEIDSTVGEGTTVTVWFPIEPTSAEGRVDSVDDPAPDRIGPAEEAPEPGQPRVASA